MNLRRVGLAVLASAALVVSGCGKPSHPGAPAGVSGSAASAAAVAKTVLVNSAGALAKTPYKFAVASKGASGSGAADPAGGRSEATLKRAQAGTTFTVVIVIIGRNVWAKVDLGAQANQALGIPTGKYMHIDSTKVTNKAALGLNTANNADPAGTTKLMQGLVSAQRIDDKHYHAVLDLTKAADSIVAQDNVNKLGERARAVPATITLDGQGRLIELDIDLGGGDIVKMTYSGYGTAVAINQPAKASIVEAPQKVYALFNA